MQMIPNCVTEIYENPTMTLYKKQRNCLLYDYGKMDNSWDQVAIQFLFLFENSKYFAIDIYSTTHVSKISAEFTIFNYRPEWKTTHYYQTRHDHKHTCA
jgi:hypothetical protein